MSKSGRNTAAVRRSSRPNRGHRPYKPIPVIAEKYSSKANVDEKVKENRLIQAMKNIGSRLRGFFRRNKGRKTTKTFKSNTVWRSEPSSQEEADRGRHKAKIKYSNRRKRKVNRLMHQKLRRAS